MNLKHIDFNKDLDFKSQICRHSSLDTPKNLSFSDKHIHDGQISNYIS